MNLKINLSYLNEISDGDTDFISSILVTFLEETPKDIANITTAIEEQNIDQVGKLAHKNKSTLHLLGLASLKDLAFKIEQGAKQKQTNILTNASYFVEHMKKTLPIVEEELNRLA